MQDNNKLSDSIRDRISGFQATYKTLANADPDILRNYYRSLLEEHENTLFDLLTEVEDNERTQDLILNLKARNYELRSELDQAKIAHQELLNKAKDMVKTKLAVKRKLEEVLEQTSRTSNFINK